MAGLVAEGDLFYDLSPFSPGGFGAIDPFSIEWLGKCAASRSKRQTVDYGKKFPWTNAFRFRTF